MKTRTLLFLFAFLQVFTVCWVHAGARLSPRLSAILANSAPERNIPCIVYLADRDPSLQKALIDRSLVTERALVRRANVMPANALLDAADLPVDERYVGAIAARVGTLRHRLKWFNAVSVLATPAQIMALRELPFVKDIDIVGSYRRTPKVEQYTETVSPSPSIAATDSLDYGASRNALAMINVPAVHQTGNTAQGILIGVFDNGWRRLSHVAFDSLRPRILATHDFVDHKVSVAPNDPDPSFGTHGVHTLCTIAGFKPGKVVGPAYGASFLLARTENDSSETPIEEDNWAAAIEWAESLGVQVTSTSLGYLDFDTPYTSWTWQDMNGHTTLITRAAAMAVQRGVVVVNSAGNNGLNTTHNTLNAPADADSVIAVGSVNASGLRSGFSSVGPTTSVPPRIKPDVDAQGEVITVASSTSDTSYGLTQGTSFSCPLVAGVAALVLKAHPTATPGEIMARLKLTASNAAAPDNLIGWGIVNALAAIEYTGSTSVDTARPTNGPVILSSHPNPSREGTVLSFQLPEPSRITVSVFDILGRAVREFAPFVQSQTSGFLRWDGADNGGVRVPSGVYFFRLTAAGTSGTVRTEVRKVMMLK